MARTNPSNLTLIPAFLALGLILAIPLSTLASNLCLIALLLTLSLNSWLNVQPNWRKIELRTPYNFCLLVLIIWLIIGCWYSPASVGNQLRSIKKMAKLILIPILMPVFVNPSLRRKAYFGFLLVMAINLLLGSWQYFTGMVLDLGRGTEAAAFKDHIFTNFFMAYAGFVAALMAKQQDYQQQQGFLRIFALLSIVYVFYLSNGRTGYVIGAFLFLLYFWQAKNLKIFFLACLALSLIVFGALRYSHSFKQRVIAIELELLPTTSMEPRSIDLRKQFLMNSLSLIRQKPLLGYGTGSFKLAYGKVKGQLEFPSDNPHNEYLNLWVQNGAIGLGFLLLYLGLLAKAICLAPKLERAMGLGLLASMMIGMLANSWIMDLSSGYFFVVHVALILSSAYKLRPKQI